MKSFIVYYLIIGLLLAAIMAKAIPVMSFIGFLWYALTWVWQFFVAIIDAGPIAPDWLIPYLFTF